ENGCGVGNRARSFRIAIPLLVPKAFPVLFFFFSSRRRHTSWPRDWSSDVCSSDLLVCQKGRSQKERGIQFGESQRRPAPWRPARSEERRVGKECRSRWAMKE